MAKGQKPAQRKDMKKYDKAITKAAVKGARKQQAGLKKGKRTGTDL